MRLPFGSASSSARGFLTPHMTALLGFLVIVALTTWHLHPYAVRDPSSVFFDPERAFDHVYSAVREDQANAYIRRVSAALGDDAGSDPHTIAHFSSDRPPWLSVGIVTAQRPSGDPNGYFPTTVGSLLVDLPAEERSQIHLTFSVANVDPHVHTAFNQSWFHALPDQILTYDLDANSTISTTERDRMRYLETHDPLGRVKPLHDYIRILRHGHATRAPFVLVVEDDVLAREGWLRRTRDALGEYALRFPSATSHYEDDDPQFDPTAASALYIRLFYNSRIHGWNSEEWPTYLTRSILFTCCLATILFLLRRRQLHHPSPVFFTLPTIFIILFILNPLLIGLFFLLGRHTVAPLPTGLQRMDKYGCCSQAMVFPRAQIPPLITYFESILAPTTAGGAAPFIDADAGGYADVLMEKYAQQKGLQRWAVVPSIFQHVGMLSSKGVKAGEVGKWGRTKAGNIWNFEFEMVKPEQ